MRLYEWPNLPGAGSPGPERAWGAHCVGARASLEDERPWESLCSPAPPRSVLSPPGLSSSFSASKIRSRPHISRAPLPTARGGAAMTGVEHATWNLLRGLGRPGPPPYWAWQEAHSVRGGAGGMGRSRQSHEFSTWKIFCQSSSLPWKKTIANTTCLHAQLNVTRRRKLKVVYHEIMCTSVWKCLCTKTLGDITKQKLS